MPDAPHLVLIAVGLVVTTLALVLLWEELRLLRHDVLPPIPEEPDEDEPRAPV